MLVVQSQGSTPKVHEGDGRLRRLHVLPYKWIWLVPQRAGSIWEKMFFGMKSCTLLLFKIISQAIWSWANAPVSQIHLIYSLFVWILTIDYVGHLYASGEMLHAGQNNPLQT